MQGAKGGEADDVAVVRRPCIEDRLGRHSDTDREDEAPPPLRVNERPLVAEKPLTPPGAGHAELHTRQVQLEVRE